ncbi:MAG: cache domain-containing protein [Pseudomonadota bacterium]
MRRAVYLGLIVMLTASMGRAEPARADVASRLCPVATPERAKALAERAARYLARRGADNAFNAFMDPKGKFVDGDLYVFVFDAAGILRASGGWPETVGSRLAPSPDGTGIAGRILGLARTKGRGWVHYNWYSPCSRRMEPKMSYIIKVGDYIVGVGTYKKLGV